MTGELVNGGVVTGHWSIFNYLIGPAWVIAVLVLGRFVWHRSHRLGTAILNRFPPNIACLPSDVATKQPGLLTKIGLRINQLLPVDLQTFADPKPLGILVVVVAATLPLSPIRAVALGLLGVLVLVARAKRMRVVHERMLRREFPVLVDLLGVAVQSGRTLIHSIEFVCADHQGELHQRLLHCARSIETGTRFVDALQQLVIPGSGDHLSTLVATLISAERYGVSLPLALHELAGDVRDLRRRQGESEARRVPIRMLGPLILLLLPSFALLTVAPLLASGLSSLRL